jgi:hypothetical protein
MPADKTALDLALACFSSDWPWLYQELGRTDALALARPLDEIAVRAAAVSTYLSARAQGADNQAAAMLAGRIIVNVRRALGYTFP